MLATILNHTGQCVFQVQHNISLTFRHNVAGGLEPCI